MSLWFVKGHQSLVSPAAEQNKARMSKHIYMNSDNGAKLHMQVVENFVGKTARNKSTYKKKKCIVDSSETCGKY